MDLKKVANLGAGAFGQVFLVKHGARYYALKCLGKASVIEAGLQVTFCLLALACHSRLGLGVLSWRKARNRAVLGFFLGYCLRSLAQCIRRRTIRCIVTCLNDVYHGVSI